MHLFIFAHRTQSAATRSEQAAAVCISGKEVILGMEHLISPDVTDFILQNRRYHIHSVLEEYQAQKRAGVSDPSGLSQVSHTTSSFSREWCSRIVHLRHAPRAA